MVKMLNKLIKRIDFVLGFKFYVGYWGYVVDKI